VIADNSVFATRLRQQKGDTRLSHKNQNRISEFGTLALVELLNPYRKAASISLFLQSLASTLTVPGIHFASDLRDARLQYFGRTQLVRVG
jgi:hypothetical protein